MSKARKNLRDYQGLQGDIEPPLDFDKQREEDDENREKLKKRLRDKRNEFFNT